MAAEILPNLLNYCWGNRVRPHDVFQHVIFAAHRLFEHFDPARQSATRSPVKAQRRSCRPSPRRSRQGTAVVVFLALLIAVATFLRPGPAQAGPIRLRFPVRLEPTRGPDAEPCPEEELLRAEVKRRLGDINPFQPDASHTFTATVTRDRAALLTVMQLRDATGMVLWVDGFDSPGPCTTLVSAMALAIVVEEETDLCTPASPEPWLPPPDGFATCIYSHEDRVCPDDYAEKHVFYGGLVDTRDCTPCGCGDATGASCTVTTSIYSDAACQVPLASNPVSSTVAYCGVTPPGLGLGSKSAVVTAVEPGTCAPSGGEPIGEVTPIEPSTVCCAGA